MEWAHSQKLTRVFHSPFPLAVASKPVSRLMTSQVLRVDRSPWDKRRASSGPCGSATSDESLSVRDKGDHDELSPMSVLWLENLLSVREIGETEPSAVLPRRFRSCAV